MLIHEHFEENFTKRSATNGSYARGLMVFFIGYLLIGCIAGIISGLLGFAGGVIVVPAVTFVFSYQPTINKSLDFHFASGTSLATMIVTVGVSALTYALKKNVLWNIVIKFLPGILLGVIMGVICSTHFSTTLMKIIFGIFLFFVSIHIFLNKQKIDHHSFPPTPLLFFLTILIGFVSGLLGIGVASLTLPLLLFFNTPIRKAAGICATCSFPVAIIGTLGFMWMGLSHTTHIPYTTGYIYWPAFFGIIITSVIFAPLAAHFADRVHTKILTRIFAVLLFCIGTALIIHGTT
jgi:uncharacterized membrane protein YfcA